MIVVSVLVAITQTVLWISDNSFTAIERLKGFLFLFSRVLSPLRPYQALATYSQGKVQDKKSERTFTNTSENPRPLLLSSITPRLHLPRILPVQLDFIRVLQELPGLPLDNYGRDCRQCGADTRNNVKSIQFSPSLIDEECVNCLKYTLPPQHTHTHAYCTHREETLSRA